MHAAGAGLEGQAFTRARDAEAGRIEQEACGGDADKRCQVVSLYRGGQFKLYTYKKYSDVRLAFAPEDRAATFGGDLDNFSFPRFAIDAAFIRLYENDAPAVTPTHFVWNADQPVEGTPVFVSGSPGATQRLLTQDQLFTVRDVVLPMDQLIASELRGRLIRFSEESEENAFIAMDPIVGLENTYKRGLGRMRALTDPGFMATRAAERGGLPSRRARGPTAGGADPWTRAVGGPADRARTLSRLCAAGRRNGHRDHAGRRRIAAVQLGADPGARRAGAGEAIGRAPAGVSPTAAWPAVQSGLFAERPVYPALEQVRMEWWLSKTREWLTVDDPARPRPAGAGVAGTAVRRG